MGTIHTTPTPLPRSKCGGGQEHEQDLGTSPGLAPPQTGEIAHLGEASGSGALVVSIHALESQRTRREVRRLDRRESPVRRAAEAAEGGRRAYTRRARLEGRPDRQGRQRPRARREEEAIPPHRPLPRRCPGAGGGRVRLAPRL